MSKPKTRQGYKKVKIRDIVLELPPFLIIYDDTIKLVPTESERRDYPDGIPPQWWDNIWRLVIVEAIEGTWLSKITSWYLDAPLAAYDHETIGLLHGPAADWLSSHVVDGAVGDKANFPNLYKKGNVPAGYDNWDFDPDKIYPGQRFYMLIEPKIQIVSFSEPLEIVARPRSFWDGVWAGVGESHSGDLFVIGAHSATVKFFKLTDPWEEARYAWVEISGFKFGPGLGGSAGLAFFLAHGIESPHEFDRPMGGWDFDIALTVKLSGALKGLKGIGKIVDTLEKYKKLRWGAEQLIKNRGALKPGIYSVPIAGPGMHLWLGFKFGEAELISAGREQRMRYGKRR